MTRRNPNLTWAQMLVVNGAVWYLSRKRRKSMLQIIEGYKTYITAIVLIVRLVFKHFGYDVPNEQISIAIDVVLGFLIMVFRTMAKPKAIK